MAKKGIFGLLAGIGLGAGLGVLFAPEKGEVTRKKLKEKLDDELSKINKTTKVIIANEDLQIKL